MTVVPRPGSLVAETDGLHLSGSAPFDLVHPVATDDPGALPEPTGLPRLRLDDAAGVVAFLLSDPARYEYNPPEFPSAAAGA